MFAFQDSRAPVDVAFTDRHGGVSDGPYASLNLAASGGDDPDTVEQNMDRVAIAFARGHEAPGRLPLLVSMSQVHGADVHVVDKEFVSHQLPGAPIVADGMVTVEPGVVLMVRAADCVPVLLADPDRGVVGAAHAGRPGMVAGIIPSTVARMRQLGAERIVGWLGPHVCGACYEVPEQMRTEVAAVVPESYAETSWGTPSVDIGAGVRAQLKAQDVEVVDASRCTVEDDDLFSYRRQGKASGRLAGLVWVRP
ncbi:MAG TPA: polyphenol oxidase family protein [Nocardioidaceae bacterium]|nr:polyphenol oxidase family protein [Nocardioidaceae bacterium]